MDVIPVYSGTGIFVIKEQIFSKNGLPSFGNIGPSAMQVQRTVYQLRKQQEVLLDGKPVDYNDVTLWQKFRIIMGDNLVMRDKQGGRSLYSLEYSGFETYITPLDGAQSPLPEFLGKAYKTNIPTPYIFGKDPLPQVKLYGRQNINFVMADGGQSPPTAMAKYNKKTRELVIIHSEAELKSLLLSLTRAEKVQ